MADRIVALAGCLAAIACFVTWGVLSFRAIRRERQFWRDFDAKAQERAKRW